MNHYLSSLTTLHEPMPFRIVTAPWAKEGEHYTLSLLLISASSLYTSFIDAGCSPLKFSSDFTDILEMDSGAGNADDGGGGVGAGGGLLRAPRLVAARRPGGDLVIKHGYIVKYKEYIPQYALDFFIQEKQQYI